MYLEPIQALEHWLIVFMHARVGQGDFILVWLCSFDGTVFVDLFNNN